MTNSILIKSGSKVYVLESDSLEALLGKTVDARWAYEVDLRSYLSKEERGTLARGELLNSTNPYRNLRGLLLKVVDCTTHYEVRTMMGKVLYKEVL